MAGSTFQPGETKVRPGVYVRSTNAGPAELPGVIQGVVAALLRASWGPLASVQSMESLDSVEFTYGSEGTIAVAQEAFRGGARRVLAYRLGGGAPAKASKTLQDTTATPVDAVRIDAKYEGVRGNSFTLTIRDSLTDPTGTRELLVYEGTTLRQTIQFVKGSAGDGEPAALVAAVAASGSSWITATKLADGSKILATVSNVPMAGGVDPTVSGQSYSDGLTALESESWNVLVADSEDAAIHATLQTYIDRVRSQGKRGILVVGEPTSVAFATRCADAKAFNDPAVVYVANGFTGSDGAIREGYKAAARIAGMVASAPVTSSLTHAIVTGATGIVEPLANADVETAISSGCLVFTSNARGQVQVEYGINTLVSLSADQDAGWKKIRRVRTRDNLIERIVAAWDPLVGVVNNDANGAATLMAAAQAVVNQMVAEGALLGGTVTLDPANPPSGESVWFIANVDDLDSAEKLYLTFQFRFTA